MSPKNKIITLDGPAGAGKGTVAKKLAKELGYLYLDSGAMYRTIALALKKADFRDDNPESLKELLNNIQITIGKSDSDKSEIYLDGKEVSDLIRTSEISSLSSKVATKKVVRQHLVNLQRQIAGNTNIVAEGRDMGTHVFPNAEHKFFLDASVEERAKRRFLELKEINKNTNFEEVLEEIIFRDKQDMERKESPLHPAADAVIIDTTNLSIDQVVGKILVYL